MSSDFDTDMETVQNYVRAVVEAKTKITMDYAGALDNVQLTFQTASSAEARPDIVGVMLKAGIKFAEKQAVDAVKESTGADLGPLVELVHAINDEVERAARAAEGVAAADWIGTLRARIVDQFTQDTTGEALRQQIEDEYKQNDEGGRGGYIAGVQIELEALRGMRVPKVAEIALGFYVSWINQNFDDDCMNGPGVVQMLFDSDGTATAATVITPLGARVADGLNKVIGDAGVARLMDLDVVKKVCRDDLCVCFEGNNGVRKDLDDQDAHDFLMAQDNWNKFRRFTT